MNRKLIASGCSGIGYDLMGGSHLHPSVGAQLPFFADAAALELTHMRETVRIAYVLTHTHYSPRHEML